MSTHDDVTVRVTVGEQQHDLPRGSSVADVVELMGQEPGAVSTAVNGQFVARTARAEHVLADGDQVLLFQPIVGG